MTGEPSAHGVQQRYGGSARQRVDHQRQRGEVAPASDPRQACQQQRVERRGRAQHPLADVVDEALASDEIAGVAEGDVGVVNGARAGQQTGGDGEQEDD